MSPRISVFLLSHNKHGYVREAVASVLDQGFSSFELHVIDNSTDDRTRRGLKYFLDQRDDSRVIYHEVDVPEAIRAEKYVPAWLINQFYPKAAGEIILYISDDDLFVPGIFRAVSAAFDRHPDWAALYFTLTRVNALTPGPPGQPWMAIEAFSELGSGQVDCHIDGGQVAYRKHVLDDIGQPYFQEQKDQSSHCDGIHLQRITDFHVFHPLPNHGVIHRHTPKSVWN